jgi:vanillate/4-hydroxybenzoate decarboxylase subunit C
MAYDDLRGFLAVLEKNGQLLRIRDAVMPEPDVAAAAQAAVKLGANAPAVLFENIRGYSGRLVLNVHGSWANHALMLGMAKTASIREQFYELDRRWPGSLGSCVRVDNAPCKQVKITSGINLFDILPLYRSNTYDGGCYLAKACVISRDPDEPHNFATQNVGTYRMQVVGKDGLLIQPLVFHDIAVHLQKAEARNEPLPIAVALGNEPIITFMASTPIGYDQSEYEFAAALRQQPYPIIEAETSELDLPAGAEVILEGEILPRSRTVEGPFGEFTGGYSGARKQPRIRIHTVTHRENPIFENLCLGIPWTEIDYLMALNTSIPLYRQVKASFPEVTAVNATYVHGIVAIVSTKCRLGGYGKAVAMRLLSTPHGMPYAKFVIVVDDFVDPFNLDQVMWALATRVNPDRHISIISNCPGMPLDPSSDPPGMHSKVIIDATTPVAPEPWGKETFPLEESAHFDRWFGIIKTLLSHKGADL